MAVALHFRHSWDSMNARQGLHREVDAGPGAGGQCGEICWAEPVATLGDFEVAIRLAADTDEEALRLFESRARWKMDRNLGRIDALLSPEEATRDQSPAEQFALSRLRESALIGSAATVGHKLRQLATRLLVDELVLITWTHDPAAQFQSYELLA